MNKVFLLGNLTRDPELKSTQSGKNYVRVGIAVKRSFTKDKDAVDFFNLVAWDQKAEFLSKYFSKGSRAIIEGRLQTGSYENKDGVKVNTVEIIVENVEFGSYKKDSDAPKSSDTNPYSKPKDDLVGEPIDPEDTPF